MHFSWAVYCICIELCAKLSTNIVYDSCPTPAYLETGRLLLSLGGCGVLTEGGSSVLASMYKTKFYYLCVVHQIFDSIDLLLFLQDKEGAMPEFLLWVDA